MNGSKRNSWKQNAWENWIKFFLWKSFVDNLAMRSLPMKRAGLGGHSRMVRGFDIHVAAADVSLTDASLRSNTLTSQDLTSLTSTSTSMVPTLMSIYLLLIQHVQYSLLRQLFHLLCQASGLPELVRLTWKVPGQMDYIPAPLVEKNSWKRIFLIHIHMQIYVFLGHMAWNLLRIPCWCLVLFFFILAVTSVSTIGIAEMHPNYISWNICV